MWILCRVSHFLLPSINLKAAVDGRASRNPSIRKAYPSQSMILMGWCEQKFDRSKLTVILVMCLMTVQLSLAEGVLIFV